MSYTIEVTESVAQFIEEYVTTERIYGRIRECMGLLADYPRMGRTYDPEYAAARTPFACRQMTVSDTPFTLYYLIDDEAAKVVAFSLGFSAEDPRRRFAKG